MKTRKIPFLNLYLVTGKELKKQSREQQDLNILRDKVLADLLAEGHEMRKICKRYGYIFK